MKSKYFLALVLIGVLPAILLTGVYFYMIFTQAPPAAKVKPIDQAGQQVMIQMLQTQVQTMSSSMLDAITRAHGETPNLVAHGTDTDLDNFVHSHPGLSVIAVYSMKGKFLKAVPPTPAMTDIGTTAPDEFANVTKHFAEQGGTTYQFYTQRFGYPAFVNVIPLTADTFAEVVLNLATFFRNIDAKSGDLFLLDAASGRYLYHSNPTQLAANFNNPPEAWLTKVATDLSNKQSGTSPNGNASVAVYSYLGFGAFGIVHTFPLSGLQPAAAAVAVPKAPSFDQLPELLTTPMGMTSIIALAACLAWVFIVGSICYGMILAPLRRASGVILNASQGKGSLTPESARSFGGDEVGQMVQAASLLMQKLEQEKQAANQEKEEALRRGKTEVEAKSREAANQASAAQQQAQAARADANEKNQTLNDKLKELDALKGMSEGLRNQNEQAKAENAKLRGQINEIGQSQADFQKQISATQNELKEMESKMLKAVAASSAIHVSQVRAAAIRTMAEELKTTLGIIKGYVSSTLGSTSGGISEKQQEFLGMVINRSARLEKFINDLLDIYQVEIEQQDSKTEDVNLASEIEGLAFNFQAQADVKTIKIKVEAKPDIPKVPIVRRRFNQLWNILYLQIIKDAPRGSSITIGVEPIGDNVKVTVQDPGLVVVPDSLPKLFDEFYDPKHPASPQLAGTGLKFALVKTILAAHGGGAVAEKAEPGTRLTLTFPTKVKKPGAAPPAPMVAPSPSVSAAPAPKLGTSPSLTPPPLRATPGVMAPGAGSVGMPKPPAPGATPGIGLPKPPMPGAPAGAPGLGVPKPAAPGAMPPLGTPKPATPAAAAGGAGVLDALISGGNIPPVNAPGLPKPTAPPPPGAAAAPGLPKPPAPSLGVPGAAPGLPKPPMPSAPPPAPGAAAAPPGLPKPPMSSPGALDALLDKKPAAPAPGIPTAPKPPVPGIPPIPGAAAPAAPRPPIPGAPPAIPGPAAGVAPKAPLPVPPGIPGTGPMTPRPPLPSAPPVPGAAAPGVPSAAPKVIPTNIKPTTPPPGILDLDNVDGPKLDAGAPKPPTVPLMPGVKPPMPPLGTAPGATRPGMPPPGMPPMGGAKSPGVPPGGLQATPPPKKDDGELIE